MVWRILQFVLGAALAGGGGYLAWTQREAMGSLLPPGPSGLPLLFLVGVAGVTSGLVFLVSAVHPRPNQRRAREAVAARDETALQEADRYYSERARAADRDWRAADITPPVAPQPFAPPPAAPQPVPPRAAPPAPQLAPQTVMAPPPPPKPQPVAPPVAPPPLQQPVAPPPVAAPKPVPPPPPAAVTPPPAPQPPKPPQQPVAPPPSPQTRVVPAAPANPFPATVTLAPLPRAEGPSGDSALAAIRTAIAEGRLPDAERLLNAARDTAVGLDLAKLTAMAGQHAAASGQLSHARWLWRLALKRFGELDALGLPEAKAVAESLGK